MTTTPTPAASGSAAPTYVVAICEDFQTVGYLGDLGSTGIHALPSARRFADEQSARDAGLAWEAWCDETPIYTVVRKQVAA